MSGIDQKEYLKKYLGIGKGSGEKKKKKKSKKIGNGLKIVDDDIDLRLDEEIQLDLTGDNEEAPQIVSIIDDRPPSLRVDEETRSKLWKPIGALSETDYTRKTIKSDGNKKQAKNSSIKQYSLQDERDCSPAKKYKESKNRGKQDMTSNNRQESSTFGEKSLVMFPKKVIGEALSSEQDFSPLRQNRRNEDISPPRRNNKHNSDSDNSPPRKSTEDRDNSPMRKRRKSNDFSPLRRRSEEIDSSPPRAIKREKNENFSPPRRKQSEETDSSSPKRSKKQITGDISPPRRQRTEKTDELSPLRKRRDKKIDSLPPRHMDREKNQDNSPRSSKSQEADSSPPRRSRSGRNDDLSPPRKKRGTEADFSPPRRVKREKTEENSPPRRKNSKKSRWGDSEEPNEKLQKTLDGKTAGLQDATELVRETEELKKREEELFKNLSSEISGVNAATVVRQKKNDVDFEEEERKKKAEEENKKKYDRWGKGLKQVDDMNEKLKNDLYEMSKPLARYADDEDLERHLKEQEREGDPMLAYIRQKKQKKAVEEGQPGIQQYEGDAPPNRFGIRPGYRWDGVDRSNGYEKRWFETQNSRKASIEESYKWSTEDM